MKATINGIPVEGTPAEIAELMRLHGAQAAPAPLKAADPPSGPTPFQPLPWAPIKGRWQQVTGQTVSNPDPYIVTYA